MNEILLYSAFVCLGLLLLCLVGNLIMVAKKGKPSVLLSRGLYVFGISAVICNGIRMAVGGQGTLVLANVVVLICIVVAFVRMERERRNGGTEQDTEEA